MDRQFVQNNAASRQRLHDLIARLDDEAMQRIVHDDWTVSALLTHIAFWEQSCVVRWDQFDRAGSFIGFSDETMDIVNAANFPTWRAPPATPRSISPSALPSRPTPGSPACPTRPWPTWKNPAVTSTSTVPATATSTCSKSRPCSG